MSKDLYLNSVRTPATMAEPLFQNTNNYSKCISGPGSLVFRKVGKGEDQNNHNPSTSEKDRRTRNSLWVISSLFVSFTLGCITKHKASNLYKSDSPDLEKVTSSACPSIQLFVFSQVCFSRKVEPVALRDAAWPS